eukprot:7608668-Heterocapsa_arctica.AAC.1
MTTTTMTISSTTTMSTTTTQTQPIVPCQLSCPHYPIRSCQSTQAGTRCRPRAILDSCVSYSLSLVLSCQASNQYPDPPNVSSLATGFPAMRCQ